MAEADVLEYGQKHGLDVITVCPSLVIGPMLQPNVNASSLFLITILKGLSHSITTACMNYQFQPNGSETRE